MSFTGAVAVAVVFFVRLLFKKLPKKYVCILWAIVLIRLLCPLTIPTLVIGQPDIPEPIPGNIMEMDTPYIASEIEVVDNAVNQVLEQQFTPNADTFKTSANPLQIAMTIGALIWSAGIAVMVVYTVWNLVRFHKRIREAIPDNTYEEPIYRCAVETPVVTGIVKPRIYLPFDLEESQLMHVLAHEKMHIRRKDHILKLLFYIAVVVHWFNPFVWLAYRLLERDMEMACDEAVLEELGIEEKKNYCESLLTLASSKNHFVGNPVAFGESDVKMRIKNVLNYKKPYFWMTIIAVTVIIVVAISCLSSPKTFYESGSVTVTAEIDDVEYPLTKEAVDAAFEQVNLPGVVSEEEYDSEIRTSIGIRDEEDRLIASIASTGDGDARFLGITLIGYLRAGGASVFLPEEKWEDIVNFAALLYGFQDKNLVYNDFIENFEEESILTEYQRDEELYYEKQYEWLKSYGDISCQINVKVATDGTREISGISFYNQPEYSTKNSEMAAKNFMYYLFTSIPGRYEAYEEAAGGAYDPINRDEAFLESDYSISYLNHYKDRATENCLQNMENSGYFTLVDYYAAKADAQVRFINAALTESEETKGDKNTCKYLYTASLTCEKDGETEEFTVQGSVGVVNQVNGWKVYDFLLSDTEALGMYITGESAYREENALSANIEPQQLTLDLLLEAVETNTMESVPWHNYADEVNEFADGGTSSYYISCNFEYQGKEQVLNCSLENEDETLRWVILTIKEDESSIRIYDREDGGVRYTKEAIVEFAETDHDIRNEISFELPEGLTLGAYNANVELEGGCLILPMAYEGNEESTPASWMTSGVVSRFTQEYYLHWNGEKIERLSYYDNHTIAEVVEQVDGLCAPALLMSVEHDLYTAAQQAELMENGTDLDAIEIVSKYWYLVIAEPGEEYGYVITLNQKNFTKDDILKLGKTIQLL